MSMKVKVVYGSDIRRWHLPSTNRYASLLAFIRDTFGLETNYFLQFEDDEGDRMTLSSESHLEDALTVAQQESRKSLKIFLIPTSINEARQDALSQFRSARSIASFDQFEVLSQQGGPTSSNDLMSSSVVVPELDDSPQPAAPVQVQEVQQQDMATQVVDNEAKEDPEPFVPEPAVEVKPEPEQPQREKTWQEELHEFLSDEAVNALVPDFVRSIVKRLREMRDPSLDIAVTEIASKEEFESILTHEFYQTRILPKLDVISLRAQQLIPVILTFDDNHIASIIPQLIDTAVQMLSGVDDIELDCTPIFATLFPTWMAMMNANTPQGGTVDLAELFGCNNASDAANQMMNACDNGAEKKEDEVIVHEGIICDMCNMDPIKGARFKCGVCSDFDICEKCESTQGHNPQHPMLKLYRPCKKLPRGRMHGLREMFDWGCRKGRNFQNGGGWGGRGRPHHPFWANFGMAQGADGGAETACPPHMPPPPPHGHHPMHGMPPPPHHGHGPHHMPPHHGPHHPWARFAQQMFGQHGAWAQHQQQQQQQAAAQSQAQQQSGCDQQVNNNNEVVVENAPSETSETPSLASVNDNTGGGNGKCKGKKLRAVFVADVNMPDRTHYPPSTVLEKAWRMQNTGHVEWGDNCELVFVKGDAEMSLEKRYPVPNAQPQEIVQVSATIKTPQQPDRYCAYYRLQKNGVKFGPRVWVDLFVTEDENKKPIVSNITSGSDDELSPQDNDKDRKELKKQEKLERKQEKIAKKIEKLEAKQAHLAEKAAQIAVTSTSTNTSNQLGCICGEHMLYVRASEAYGGFASRLRCDICGRLAQNNMVYHCPKPRQPAHPSGYDLCEACGNDQLKQFQMFAEFEAKAEAATGTEVEAPVAVEAEAVVEVDDAILETSPVAQKVEPDPVIEVEPVDNNAPNFAPSAPDANLLAYPTIAPRSSATSTSTSDPVVKPGASSTATTTTSPVETSVPVPVPVQSPSAGSDNGNFPYQTALESLQGMGFGDEQHLKFLLVKSKGNVDRVISDILGA